MKLNVQHDLRFLIGVFVLIGSSSCVKYNQGTPESQPINTQSIPDFSLQTKVFFINPPITAKVGEGNDVDSIKARAAGEKNLDCVQYQGMTWIPNLTSPPANKSDDQHLPSDLKSDLEKSFDKNTNPKIKRRIKISKSEFSLQASDLTLYKNDPNPLEVVESLNLFSEDILPKKITGNTLLGNTPRMLLRYMKYLNDGSNLKITSVTSIKKIAGGYFGNHPGQAKNNVCSGQVINGLDLGAGMSVAISITFQSSHDREAFQGDFGLDYPFSKDKKDLADTAMSTELTAAHAKIEVIVAEIGGDAEKTKAFVSKISCSVQKLDDCRKARRDIFRYFFTQELSPPTSLAQTNGWVPVDLETASLNQKNNHK